MSRSLLVDATTAAQARGGIHTVTRGFLDGAAQLPAAAGIEVLGAPDLEVPPPLTARRTRIAASRVGRIALQRALLPSIVSGAMPAGGRRVRAECLLLLDASMPPFGLGDIRTACFVHDLLPLEHPQYWSRTEVIVKRAAYRAIGRSRPTVFTSSAHNAERIQSRLDVKVRLARFGCGTLSDLEADAALERKTAPDRERPRIVYVGALEPRKDLATLLEAFERVAARHLEVELVLIGEMRGQARQAIAAWRRRSPEAAQRVRWTGHAPRDLVIDEMATASIVVYPSWAEGFGLPVLEALALGTPVIAADLLAIRSWAGDTCEYAAAGDVDAWADAMLRVLGGAHPPRDAGHALSRDYRWRAFAATIIEGW